MSDWCKMLKLLIKKNVKLLKWIFSMSWTERDWILRMKIWIKCFKITLFLSWPACFYILCSQCETKRVDNVIILTLTLKSLAQSRNLKLVTKDVFGPHNAGESPQCCGMSGWCPQSVKRIISYLYGGFVPLFTF